MQTVGLVGYDDPDSYEGGLALLREAGYVVLPFEEFCEGDDGSPEALRSTLEGMADMAVLVDLVVTAPGWEERPGCRTLVQFAALLGKPVRDLGEALLAHAPEPIEDHRRLMLSGDGDRTPA